MGPLMIRECSDEATPATTPGLILLQQVKRSVLRSSECRKVSFQQGINGMAFHVTLGVHTDPTTGTTMLPRLQTSFWNAGSASWQKKGLKEWIFVQGPNFNEFHCEMSTCNGIDSRIYCDLVGSASLQSQNISQSQHPDSSLAKYVWLFISITSQLPLEKPFMNLRITRIDQIMEKCMIQTPGKVQSFYCVIRFFPASCRKTRGDTIKTIKNHIGQSIKR